MRPPIFSVTLMRSSGSRVDWKIFFVIFTKLFPRKRLFCIAKILVLMVSVRFWYICSEDDCGTCAQKRADNHIATRAPFSASSEKSTRLRSPALLLDSCIPNHPEVSGTLNAHLRIPLLSHACLQTPFHSLPLPPPSLAAF